MASGPYDTTVRVWGTKTGATQQILIAKGAVNELHFSQDASYVTTNLRALSIPSTCGSHASNSPKTKLDRSILERRWVIFNGNKALWLPPEFRPICSGQRQYVDMHGMACLYAFVPLCRLSLCYVSLSFLC
jgi:hypothetical protein